VEARRSPQARLRQFERVLFERAAWEEVEAGVEVRLVDHPDGRVRERYVLCRSVARREKEAAMFRRQRDGLRAMLEQIDASLKTRPARPEVVERRIGKWMGRHTAAEKMFHVKVLTEGGWARGLHIEEDEGKMGWAQAAQGAYLLRTNCQEQDPRKIWRWYMQLTEVEEAFRIGKSDLGLRPIYHHRRDRVEAHILVCFLGLVMWRSLEMWLQAKGLGNCARQVLHELDTIRSMDVILPVRDKAEMRLRLVAKPEKLAADLLSRMHLRLPTRPKYIQNVVEKN
jgi:transposase